MNRALLSSLLRSLRVARFNSSGTGFEGVDGEVIPTRGCSAGYFAHYYAPSQVNTDGKLFDLLGAADGTFGSNLSAANAWASAGYVSTLDPAAGAVDSGIVLPALGWDWAGGESLMLFWKGSIAPEGANTGMMGQASSSSQRGPEFRALTTGQMQLVCYDGTAQIFGPSTPNTTGLKPFVLGEEHSFAIALDPVSRIAKLYVDGEFTNQASFASLNLLNSTNALRLGSSAQTPTASNGIATKTRALVILKGRANKDLPSNLASTIRRLHRNPGRLLSSEAW